jgi:predicted MFS family arabinose efflux permease
MVPAMAMLSAVPEAKDRGACMSITSSLQQLAGGLGAVLAGMIIVQSSKYALLENVPLLGYVSIIMMLLCVWFMYKVSNIVKIKVQFKTVDLSSTSLG